MTPYQDSDFRQVFSGPSFGPVLNQQVYVALEVKGVDELQISSVLDSCWATKINDPSSTVRWDLITRE